MHGHGREWPSDFVHGLSTSNYEIVPGIGVLGEDMKDKAVIVIGVGGHAKVLLVTFLDRGVKVVGFLEKDGRVWGGQPSGNSHPGDG